MSRAGTRPSKAKATTVGNTEAVLQDPCASRTATFRNASAVIAPVEWSARADPSFRPIQRPAISPAGPVRARRSMFHRLRQVDGQARIRMITSPLGAAPARARGRGRSALDVDASGRSTPVDPMAFTVGLRLKTDRNAGSAGLAAQVQLQQRDGPAGALLPSQAIQLHYLTRRICWDYRLGNATLLGQCLVAIQADLGLAVGPSVDPQME